MYVIALEYRETQAVTYGKHKLGLTGNISWDLRETQAESSGKHKLGVPGKKTLFFEKTLANN